MRRLFVAPFVAALAHSLAAQDDPTPSMMSPVESDPALQGVIVNEPEAFDGYTLFAPLNSRTVYLMDLDGEVVHIWPTDSAPGGWMYLMDDGALLRGGLADDDPKFSGGGAGGLIQKLAPDGALLWHWRLANDSFHHHHDIEPLPNGNILVIAWERIPAEQAIAFGRAEAEIGRAGLWPDSIVEIRPTQPDDAEIVWEWHTWHHVVQDTDPERPAFGIVPENPGRIDINYDHRAAVPMTEEERREQEELERQMAAVGYTGDDEEEDEGGNPWDGSGDWMHTNAVDYHAELDLIVLSSPELNEIFVIDHSTTTDEAEFDEGGRWDHGGRILWRWGNPRTYGLGDETDRKLFYQHDPTWVPGEKDGELRLIVFNNGRGRADGDYSSVDELVLPFHPERGFEREAGEPFGPSEPVWSYSDPDGFYSAFISGAQRLPNGNTLICSGAPGRLFEVTRDGRVVWDFRNPYGGDHMTPSFAGTAPTKALFRGTRLARNHPGVVAVLEAP